MPSGMPRASGASPGEGTPSVASLSVQSLASAQRGDSSPARPPAPLRFQCARPGRGWRGCGDPTLALHSAVADLKVPSLWGLISDVPWEVLGAGGPSKRKKHRVGRARPPVRAARYGGWWPRCSPGSPACALPSAEAGGGAQWEERSLGRRWWCQRPHHHSCDVITLGTGDSRIPVVHVLTGPGAGTPPRCRLLPTLSPHAAPREGSPRVVVGHLCAGASGRRSRNPLPRRIVGQRSGCRGEAACCFSRSRYPGRFLGGAVPQELVAASVLRRVQRTRRRNRLCGHPCPPPALAACPVGRTRLHRGMEASGGPSGLRAGSGCRGPRVQQASLSLAG